MNKPKQRGTAAETAVLRYVRERGYIEKAAVRLRSRLIVVEPSGCHEFTGALKDGYGKIWAGSKKPGAYRQLWFTHRLAWTDANGPIPDGAYILHRCDNRRCCNVDHLFLGTHADNMRDMVSKGRQRPGPKHGEAHPRARLTEAQVIEARRLREAGMTYPDIAKKFEVSRTTMRDAVAGKTWKKVA